MATKYQEMRARIEILEKLDSELDSIIKNAAYTYKVVKETPTDEQAKNWKGELLWEDAEKTVPKMHIEKEYDFVPKDKSEMTEEDYLTVKIAEDIKKTLLKLV